MYGSPLLAAILLLLGAPFAIHGTYQVWWSSKTRRDLAVMEVSRPPIQSIHRRTAVAMICAAVELAVALMAFAWAGWLTGLDQAAVTIVTAGTALLLVVFLLEGVAGLKKHPVR